MKCDHPEDNKGDPMCPRILQLLPKIHGRIEQNSKNIICLDKKGVHRQMGMGIQGTTGDLQVENETHYTNGTGIMGVVEF